MLTAFHNFRAEDFPFTIAMWRTPDPGPADEPVWQATVDGPGGLRIPLVGGVRFVRVTTGDGRVLSEHRVD